MQGRHALAPVGIDCAHPRIGQHHRADPFGDRAHLAGIGAVDAEGDRERRIRPEDELGRAHPRCRSEAVRHRLAQMELERVARCLARRQHDDLGEGRIGQLGRHGEIETRRALADIRGDDLRLGLLAQPCFHLRRGGAGLLDRGALGHLHLDQHLGPIGLREELLLDRPHADEGDQEGAERRQRHPGLAPHRPGDDPAHAAIIGRVVDCGMAAADRLDIGQQFHAKIRSEHHRHDPGG